MSKAKDLIGQKFGLLTVVEKAEKKGKNPNIRWRCRCDCGNETTVFAYHLTTGHTKSCGCLQKEFAIKHASNLNKSHGLSNTRLHSIWSHIKRRCLDKDFRSYPDYGGRGIAVCDEWKDNFTAFYEWSIQNGYSDDLSIDRIDVNGDYCPANCRWATPKMQSNNRRNTLWITYKGKTQTVVQWAEELNISYQTLYARLFHRNWSIDRALNEPIANK